MDRRDILKAVGLSVFAGSTPVVSYAIDEEDTAIGPVVLERTCDGGKNNYTAEEIAERDKRLKIYDQRWGCGTRFRWYLGTVCVCPKCGAQYVYDCEMLKEKRFWVKS